MQQRSRSKLYLHSYYSHRPTVVTKSTNTFKALLAVSPAGLVIFASSELVSDDELVNRSGFSRLLQQGDEIMADCGFTIDLTPLGVGLNIPPFLGSRKQMDAVEVVGT